MSWSIISLVLSSSDSMACNFPASPPSAIPSRMPRMDAKRSIAGSPLPEVIPSLFSRLFLCSSETVKTLSLPMIRPSGFSSSERPLKRLLTADFRELRFFFLLRISFSESTPQRSFTSSSGEITEISSRLVSVEKYDSRRERRCSWRVPWRSARLETAVCIP